ncbi:AsnC family protein [Pseudactinotalea suaedae]|jgi:hypothetical protein|uniref:AsnC family protein n=1 Tax=Pseudactinotalea suaedae TaxID=1524924 RepID=UPI0012E180A5|nr:AsnC family protein [Pseudactinotalea suaedae]
MVRTAVGEAGGGGSFEVIEELIGLTSQRRTQVAEIERREAELVRKARQQGCSWQQIAAALDVSKQAVHKKYGRR